MGTDEEKFITIFGTRSVSHLRRVFDKYMTISGFQIEETIDRETSGNLEQLLLAVVKSIRSIPAYLAETLYYAMKGAGTDDHTLIKSWCPGVRLICITSGRNLGRILEPLFIP